MVINVYTDGGSKGNPGPSSIGIVFYVNGVSDYRFNQSIGTATNNDAEYFALIKALEILISRYHNKNPKQVNFYSDSRLMVNQVNGLFKVKNAKIREYILKIRALEQDFKHPVSYHYIPREKNSEADSLVNSV